MKNNDLAPFKTMAVKDQKILIITAQIQLENKPPKTL